MKSTLLNWLLIIGLSAAGYFVGRICAIQYLKTKYPAEYSFAELKAGGINPDSLEQYKNEKNTIMLSLMISSSIIASGAAIASSKK
jgi:hypothetical protein